MCTTLRHWAIPEKKNIGEDILFCNNLLEFFGSLFYPWKFQTKQVFTPRNSTKLYYTPRKFEGLKPRPLKIPNDLFLIAPRNSMLFLINPLGIHLLFLQYPWKFYIINPLFGLFSGIAHFIY